MKSAEFKLPKKLMEAVRKGWLTLPTCVMPLPSRAPVSSLAKMLADLSAGRNHR